MEYDSAPRRYGKKESWVAPEHARDARAMNRDYPRDKWGRVQRDEQGRRIPGLKKELVIDNRPTVMVPPRPTYMGFK